MLTTGAGRLCVSTRRRPYSFVWAIMSNEGSGVFGTTFTLASSLQSSASQFGELCPEHSCRFGTLVEHRHGDLLVRRVDLVVRKRHSEDHHRRTDLVLQRRF